MVHDLSPIIFTVYKDIAVRWYGLSYILGFICAYLIIQWISVRQKQGLTKEMVGDFITYGALGVLIGGRLGYCLFYSPDLFLKFKSAPPFWGVLAVNEGGMASHGGMIGLVVACTLFAMKHNVGRLYLYDLVALVGPVGIFFGRIANFINGELVGRIAPADYQWAVRFPSDIFSWPSGEFSRLAGLSAVVEKIPGMSREQWLEWVDQYRMNASSRESVYQGLQQIVNSIQEGNAAAKEAIGPLLDPRYPSQLFGAAGEGLFLFLVLFIFWRKPRKPGLVGALFVVVYAIVRIVDEHYRMPDAHLGFQLFGLTRGQWLSGGMLLIGLVLMFFWGRRETLPIPGWSRGQNVRIHRR
jgi:phosphatidylglycerol:prolipoprotein diacylglycerol transferase